jgi:hypothetical protein
VIRPTGIFVAYRSLTTSVGRWSSLRPVNRVCRRWCSPVHSTNSNCATSTGFSQRQSTIFFEVRPAPHLLRSGVDIVAISQWLGHASVTTTNRYATVDLEMKRKAIEQARTIDHTTTGLALWRSDASILTWLEAL